MIGQKSLMFNNVARGGIDIFPVRFPRRLISVNMEWVLKIKRKKIHLGWERDGQKYPCFYLLKEKIDIHPRMPNNNVGKDRVLSRNIILI